MSQRKEWRKRYGLALGLAVAALLTRLILAPVLGPQGLYFTFFLATAVSAALGGFWPGVVAAVASVPLSAYLIAGNGPLRFGDPADPAGLARFVFSALIVSWLCGTLFTSRERARSAEARLRESERIYRAIEESIRFGIWICDAEGRNTYASQSFLDLIGLTQEQYSNSGWRKVLHPDDVERTLADWNSCVASGGTWDVEQLFLGKDGQYHPVLARGAPVRDDRGQTICWAGINLDISRLKQAEVELEQQAVELRHSNRELEQFAFAASHDMREPLRVVNIYSELLVKAVGQPDRAADMQMFATYIHQSVDKLERLIRGLLSMSRLIHVEVERVPVSAGVAVDQALETLSNSIGESGIRVVRGDLPDVLADEGQLTQVFQNLLSNAIKYRRREGEAFVRITAQTSEGKAIFLVEDNGIGFDPVHAHSIFGLFKRLHGRDYEGTGLGLAICQRIIDHHRGRIWAESQPGEGSKFFFILPLAEQTLSAALTENQEQSTRDVN